MFIPPTFSKGFSNHFCVRFFGSQRLSILSGNIWEEIQFGLLECYHHHLAALAEIDFTTPRQTPQLATAAGRS